MATQLPNLFTSWDLSDKEILAGSVFTTTQKQVIQNLLATVAEEKLLLRVDSSNVSSFIQEEATKQGQIDILTYILSTSDATLEETIQNNSPQQ